MTILTGQQISDEELEGWAYLSCVHGGLVTRIASGDFSTGLRLIAKIGAAAEELAYRPDLDLRADHIDVRLITRDAQRVTDRDVEVARRITSIAGDAGAALDPASVCRVELALDSPDFPAIAPFWSAVLAMDARSASDSDDLTDPHGALPAVWFQPSRGSEPRQRWHHDVWIDPGQVQPRIDAALAAGGTLVSDAGAPSFWVLADPDGNRMCLCTWQGR